jgi:hypothetical protein
MSSRRYGPLAAATAAVTCPGCPELKALTKLSISIAAGPRFGVGVEGSRSALLASAPVADRRTITTILASSIFLRAREYDA